MCDAVSARLALRIKHAADLRGIVDDIRRSGIITVRGIAEELHSRAFGLPEETRDIRPPLRGCSTV
jgi:hypothetical protein